MVAKVQRSLILKGMLKEIADNLFKFAVLDLELFDMWPWAPLIYGLRLYEAGSGSLQKYGFLLFRKHPYPDQAKLSGPDPQPPG